MTEKEYREVAAFYKSGPAEANERWLAAEAAYKEQFGYYSCGSPGFGLPCDVESLEEAVRTGWPCCNYHEEQQIRAYFRRQGEKLPQEYADFFDTPDTVIY